MRSGYTLPVFACAAAVAALRHLLPTDAPTEVSLDLIEPPERVEIPIEQVAVLKPNLALAIARSDPGDNLDLTRDTPIWAMVELVPNAASGEESPDRRIALLGGEGLGRNTQTGEAAIYAYARQLLLTNLAPYLPADAALTVTLILPEGRSLAARTSNAAFGIVDGLSLLGTGGISQPLSSPEQLEVYRDDVRRKVSQFDSLVFCVGENGLDLARKQGISPDRLVKVANWLGPLLVEAGLQQVRSLLLFGYHGKLIKLAGGIFHTHHHLADGRLEILTAHCANLEVPGAVVRQIFACETVEAGLNCLRQLDAETGEHWVDRVFGAIAEAISRRTQTYIEQHADVSVSVGCLLFDRDRHILVASEVGKILRAGMC
jgi:cobalt-precorrin-5B (C1)-methyltransferase